jgi:hypothetical protein
MSEAVFKQYSQKFYEKENIVLKAVTWTYKTNQT